MDTAFWEDKRVLITGHTGFKGSWLSLWLQTLGAKVFGYALEPSTSPNLFDVAHVAAGMTSIIGDVRDADSLNTAFRLHRPEIVIHMAAQSLVHNGYRDPATTYSTNVMGTVSVLEAVRQSNGVRALISVTTDKCYENEEWVWGYRENDRLGGSDPYSSSKACAELVVSAYRRSYFSPENFPDHGLGVATARSGNVIGGGDWADGRLIPDIVTAFGRNMRVVIRNPQAIRPWQHVLQPLSGYLSLAERLYHRGPDFSQAWNFGPSDEDYRPVSWIVERVGYLWGNQEHWEQDTSDHPKEHLCLKLDSSKARHLLKWVPKLSLSASLELTVDWYLSYLQNENMRLLTEAQIAKFESLNASTAL